MSKGLNDLDTLKWLLSNYSRIEFDFTNIEKSLKALETIKNKRVNVDDLIDAIYEDSFHQDKEYNAIDIYNQSRFEHKQLIQEEYDLLKEVLL